MPDTAITLDRLCEILNAAATGQLTFDAEFEAACRRACQIVRASKKLAVSLGVDYAAAEKQT